MKNIEKRWTHMTPPELDRAIEQLPLALLPAGSLEWHGEHLATGCDHLLSGAICMEVARRLDGGVVLPSMYITAPGFVNWRGSVFFTPALVKQVAAEMYRELEKCGFRYVLVLLGHAGAMQQESFAEPAARHMEHSNLRILVTAGPSPEGKVDLGRGHAQGNETAELLATHPEAVRLDRYAPSATLIPKYAGCDPELYCTGLSSGQHQAVRDFMGREHFRWQEDLVSRVNPENAKRLFDAVCDGLVTEARGLIDS